MNGYELSRQWFDFCFENPEKISPLHTSIYFFCIEHCNRLGWKDKFGFPSQMAMEAIGVRNWRTYSNGLNDLIDWGFIKLIEKSKNQYSSNIVAIVKTTKASTKALDKALQKHGTKQGQSTASIDKQLNKELLTREQEFYQSVLELNFDLPKTEIDSFISYWTEKSKSGLKMKFEYETTFEISKRLATWKNKYESYSGRKNSDKQQSSRPGERSIEEQQQQPNRNW